MMDFKQILGAVAPVAASVLGGPFAGLAVKFLGPALGLSADTVADTQGALATISDVLTKGQMTAEQIVAVKQAELDLQKHLDDNKIKLEDLDVQRLKIDADDRDSARKREIEVKDHTTAIIAGLLLLGFFGALGYLLVYGKPADGGDALLVLLGALGGAFGSMINYYYGSSQGSQAKDKLIYGAKP